MSRRTIKTLLGLLAATLVGVGAYAASVRTRPAAEPANPSDSATQALMDWLQVPTDQRAEIQQHDPAFAQDLKTLRQTLADRRADLAAALDDPTTPDPAIRAKLEALIAADANLERRAADYLLAVRHRLSPEQKKRLFGLCAEGVRQGVNCPWRQGAPGMGRGQGGQGRGMGGMGGGMRGGRGPGAGPTP